MIVVNPTDAVAIIGCLIGAVGLVYAHLAYLAAKKSNQGSQRAEHLSAEAVCIARASNRIAVEANEAAQETNAIGARSEARETKRHDVRWDGDWPAPGRFVLTNRGEHEALDVKASIAVDGDEVKVRADTVPPGGELTFEFPRVAYNIEYTRLQRATERRTPLSEFLRPPGEGHVYLWRDIVWYTALGRQQIDRSEQSEMYDLSEFI